MSSAGTAYVDVKGDFSQFDRGGAAAASRFQRRMDSVAVGSLKRTGQTLQETGRAFRYAAAGAAAFGGAAVISALKTGAQFEQQMSRVKAVTHATGAQMRVLNADAIRLGKNTKFSAQQAAAGMYELSSAGFSVRQTHKALPGVLALAAASNIDLASAAEISSNALRGFGLDASKSGHVADVMTSAVNKASLEMSDLKDSIKYVGPVGKATGQSLEDMIAAIAEMSNQGIKGEQAGTSLRAALVRLTKPTKMAQAGLATLGVSAKDLNGPHGLKPLPELIRVLTSHSDKLTTSQRNQALAQVFGTEALTGMLAVVNQGPDKLEKLSKSFDHSEGAAKRASKTMMDNVSGSFEQLKGSVETAEIELFQKFSPTLKRTLDTATKDVNRFLTTLEKDPGFKSGDDVFGAIRRSFKASGLERDLKRELGKVDWQGLLDAGIAALAKAAGRGGVAAAKGFVSAFINGDPLTRLALGAFFVSKFVGWKNVFGRLGAQSGASFGTGMAAGIEKGGARSRLLAFGKSVGGSLALGAAVAFGPDLVKKLNQSLAAESPKFHLPKHSKFLGISNDAGIGNYKQLSLVGKSKELPDEELKKFGDTAEKAFKKFQKLGDSRGLTDLAEQAHTLAKRFPGASRQLEFFANTADNAAKQAAGSFRDVSKAHTRSFHKIIQITRDTEFEIGQKLGPNTAVGTEALLQNFEGARRKLKGLAGKDGKIPKTVQDGIDQLNRDMVNALGNLGLSKNQARTAIGLRNKAGAKGYRDQRARGGVVQFGRPGDRGPDVIPATIGEKKVAVGAGEVAAVFNGQQQQAFNELAAPVGGMRGFFKKFNKRHTEFARGGIAVGAERLPMASGGVVPAISSLIKKLDSMGFHHGSTTGGGHAPGGFHPKGEAVDYGDASNDMQKLWSTVFPMRKKFAELFGPTRVKPGPHLMHYGVGFQNGDLQADHQDHVHMALVAALGARLGGKLAAAVAPKLAGVELTGPHGAMKTMGNRVLDIVTGAGNTVLAREAAKIGGDADMPNFSGPWTTVMRKIADAKGWDLGDWKALVQGESGGVVSRVNTSSGAFGLGQFLGATKTAYAKFGAASHDGGDQIRAMAKYIADRYGNPTKAYQTWLSRSPHWYERGGMVGAAAGMLTGALGKTQPGSGLGNHYNPFTGHTTLMSTAQYNALKARWAKEHPGTALPTSSSKKSKPKKRKPPKHKARVSSAVKRLAAIRYRSPGEQSYWEKALGRYDALAERDDARYPHLEHVLSSLGAEYLVDDDENPNTPDVVNEHGVTVGGKFVPGIEQAVKAIDAKIANRNHQLSLMLTEQQVGEAGMGEMKKTIARYRKLYERIARKVKENARRIRRIKTELRALAHKKHPTKADHKRAVGLHAQLDDLHRDQKVLTGDDEPRTDTGTLHGLSEDTVLGKAWHDLDTLRGQRSSLSEITRALPITIQDKQDEISDLLKDKEDATGTKPPKPDVSVDNSELAGLLRQQLDAAHLETRVSQAQYQVLKGAPPFGGSFKDGGTVPGPLGAPRMILAHGGEEVTPVGGESGSGAVVHLHFAPGTEWLRDFVRVEVSRSDRQTVRTAGYALPGRGGGTSR